MKPIPEIPETPSGAGGSSSFSSSIQRQAADHVQRFEKMCPDLKFRYEIYMEGNEEKFRIVVDIPDGMEVLNLTDRSPSKQAPVEFDELGNILII